MSAEGWWETPDYVGQPDATAHTGFLLAEDDALKHYLSGQVVPSLTGGNVGTDMPVSVWFRYPEGETRVKFPFITIDLIGINPSYERWTSIRHVDPLHEVVWEEPDTGSYAGEGMYTPSVKPYLLTTGDDATELGPDGEDAIHVEQPLMYELMYQVSVHTRSSLHDRVLSSRFFTDIFPPRPFWVGVQADQTFRRCELRQMVQSDTMETTESGKKRIFRKVYTLSMDAEIPTNRVRQLYKVGRIHVDMYGNTEGEREDGDHLWNDEHLIADDQYTESI